MRQCKFTTSITIKNSLILLKYKAKEFLIVNIRATIICGRITEFQWVYQLPPQSYPHSAVAFSKKRTVSDMNLTILETEGNHPDQGLVFKTRQNVAGQTTAPCFTLLGLSPERAVSSFDKLGPLLSSFALPNYLFERSF